MKLHPKITTRQKQVKQLLTKSKPRWYPFLAFFFFFLLRRRLRSCVASADSIRSLANALLNVAHSVKSRHTQLQRMRPLEPDGGLCHQAHIPCLCLTGDRGRTPHGSRQPALRPSTSSAPPPCRGDRASAAPRRTPTLANPPPLQWWQCDGLAQRLAC
eukprot:COSAG01_NODE_603_length_14905_cov_12.534648_1_plen_158_part_00